MKTFAFYVFVLFTFLSASAPSTYSIGDTVEDFTLRNVDNRQISLYEQMKGKNGIIVVFTCNHCPYAQLYEQRIIELHKKFNPKGFPVLAINPNSPLIVPEDSFEEMQKRAKLKKYPFLYLMDEKQEVYPRFGATRTPHVFVIDSNLVVQYIGAIDDNPESVTSIRNRYVENAINALLAGERPEPEFTRAVGCTVKKRP
jgi:peroxiredoxin